MVSALPSQLRYPSVSCILLPASFSNPSSMLLTHILLQMHAGTVQLRRIAKKYKQKIVFVLGYN